MCTVTWLNHDDGYEVFCNRDELKTRKPALPPRLAERNGVRYLAPIDPEGRGSWIGVNEFGVALCLVNHYPPPPTIPHLRAARGVSLHREEPSESSTHVAPNNTPLTPLKGGIKTPFTGGISADEKFRSRGLLLTELLDCASSEIVAMRFEHERMEQYRPFMLLAFDLRSPFRMFVWDGKALRRQRLDEADLPVTSSSFETESVIASRCRAFNESVREKAAQTSCLQTGRAALHLADLLARFHRGHEPERSAYSVCMHRHDAATVSFTHVRVSNARAELRYLPHAPCVAVKPQRFNLRRNSNNALLVEGYQALARVNAEIVAESLAAQTLAMDSRYE